MERQLQTPTAEFLQSIQDLYERGQVLDAWRQAERFAPLSRWTGVNACVLAARLAVNCGAPRLEGRLTVRARRIDPKNPEGLAQYGYELLGRRGPLALWELLREWREEDAGATPMQQAEIIALKGLAACELRDFAAAEKWIARAEALDPARAWIRLQRAHLLERLDQVEPALETTRSALSLHPHPFYRPAVQRAAQFLQLLDRDEEAIQLLNDANATLQSGPVVAQLYSLLSETGQWTEAETALERFLELSPLIELPQRKWVSAQRARVAYHRGRRTDAARLAAELDDPFHKAFVEQLSTAPTQPERVQLDLTFVRQHFKTCAPATLAAIGRFWRLPSEHLKLAEAMCYDGTPHWQQRHWAEQNGWLVREFRVTYDSTVTLIEKGIPFAISTVEATSAHMMAVSGFDRTRGSLLLRDPSQPYTVEVQAEEFFKRQRAFGPHGMIFLPAAETARLKDVVLPDADIYDRVHAFQTTLAKHDRGNAAALLEQMQTAVPDHALTWETQLDLATYDANNTEQARCLDKLLESFPNNAAQLLRRLSCLRDVSREERIRFLEQACAAKDADPVLSIELARALEGDARRAADARSRLKRAMRFRPLDSNAFTVRADLLWEEGKLETATELYRFAANLEGYREQLYQSWFIACRQTRRTNDAIAHLQDRLARFGARSEQPALTLAWALRETEQPARARDVLTEASRLRPNDGLLRLRAAVLVAGLGETAEADRLLNAVRGKIRENDWLRAAAEIAEKSLDIAAALRWSREILEREPLALDAHGGVTRALARLEGPAAVLAHLKSACTRFPHHYGLQRMLVEWSRNTGPAAAEAAARELLRLDAADAWARRELAVALSELNRHTDALTEATEAARIEPRNSFSFSILGHLHRRLQQPAEAHARFRRAVELSADNGEAIRSLLDLARTDTERKQELEFVEQELIRQVVRGDGLLVFLDLARPVVEPENLLNSLRQAHRERPDLWHAWSALVSQLGHLGQLHEARDLAQQATEKFPHLPRVWLDLAQVYQWRNEADEIQAADRAFEINPSWNRSTVALAGALERRGKMDEARRIYERALQLSGNDAQLHACHAHLLWRQRQTEAAFTAVERALRLAPGYDWAWSLINEWAQTLGIPERTATFARALSQERPGEMRIWLMLARTLKGRPAAAEQLAAVNKALELDVHSAEAWDLKAELLTIAERFEEGLHACEEGAAVCTTNVFTLRGRQAWIEARRRKLPEAVRLIRAVLEENTSYLWGWHQLAQWLIEQGDSAGAALALEQLIRRQPHDPWVHRQLGLLRLKQKDSAGAQKSFATALQLAPTDAFAAQNIFDLQLQSGDLKGAEATLRLMEIHQPGAHTLAAKILLDLRVRNRSASLKALQALCVLPDPDPWPMDTAIDGFRRAGRTGRALKILRRALKKNSCNPQAGAAAIALLTSRKNHLAAVQLFLQLKPGEILARAALMLLPALVKSNHRLLLRWVLWRRRDVLFQNDSTWGKVGYALSSFNRMKEVVRWMADWNTRKEVEPWMLFNLCLALRGLGRYAEATDLARHILEKWGHRRETTDPRLFLAVEEALAGALPAAAQHLAGVVVRENVAYDQELLVLAKTLVEFQQAPAAERERCFRSVRRQLASHFHGGRLLRVMKDVRRTFRRAGEVFVREGGGWKARLWFGWKLNWQWFLLPLYPLVRFARTRPQKR